MAAPSTPLDVAPPSARLPESTGGETTLLFPINDPAPARSSERLPDWSEDGGTTVAEPPPRAAPGALRPTERVPACTGGGTTWAWESLVPSPPIALTTRLKSDGGGATTFGAGKVNFAADEVSRSGAETGGGTTSLTRATGTFTEPTSRWASRAAGGTTFALMDAASRILSRLSDGVGATTPVLIAGALRNLGNPTSGVGATTFICGRVGTGRER